MMRRLKYNNFVKLVVVLLMTFACFACNSKTDDTGDATIDGLVGTNNENGISEESTDDNVVYVCTGPKAKRYHRNPDCIGLSKCSSDIQEMDVSEAEAHGKTPCHKCF